jgi:hypothetical protein
MHAEEERIRILEILDRPQLRVVETSQAEEGTKITLDR